MVFVPHAPFATLVTHDVACNFMAHDGHFGVLGQHQFISRWHRRVGTSNSESAASRTLVSFVSQLESLRSDWSLGVYAPTHKEQSAAGPTSHSNNQMDNRTSFVNGRVGCLSRVEDKLIRCVKQELSSPFSIFLPTCTGSDTRGFFARRPAWAGSCFLSKREGDDFSGQQTTTPTTRPNKQSYNTVFVHFS